MNDVLESIAPGMAAAPAAVETPKTEVESSEASPEVAADAPAAVADIAAKKESGEKLTKKEEKQLKEYKLKVDGREKSVKLDLSNDEEVKKYLQKAEASDKRFQEAADVRKAAMQFIDELKKNPKKILSDPNIGVDLKKFAEEIMNEHIQELEKSPEQREREKLTKELEELKRQREEEKKSTEAKEFSRMQAEHERQLETDISTALDVSGLPKTARTVRAMADYMMIALENGIELSAQEIAPIVKNTTLSEFKEVVGSLGDDQLEDFLGKEVIARLRKKNVAKAKAVETARAVKPTGTEIKKKDEAHPLAKKQTIRDFLKV